MPAWAQWVIGAAAIVTALGVLWTKVLRPGARLISTTEEMLPLLRTLTTTFRDTPASLLVLREIAGQFSTDSGSSLRDVVNRLEGMALETKDLLDRAAKELRQSDESLKVGVETTKQLANIDRESQRQLMLEVNELTTQIKILTASGLKLEADRAQVAADLLVRERKVDAATSVMAKDLSDRQEKLDANVTGVAQDLADAHTRADAVVGKPHGAAADVASQSPPSGDERKRERREIEDARRAQWEIDQESDETEESPT